MTATLTPSTLKGSISSIPSKSYAHRLLICSALGDKKTTIHCSTLSEDILATVGCMKSLGADITYQDGYFTVIPISKPVQDATMDCYECGTLLRFLLPVICALGVGGTLIGRGRLPARPLSPLYEELVAHGAELSPQGLPLTINGKLQSGDYTLAANISSQFIGGLLMALPLLDGDSTLTLTGTVESRPYIDMTLDVLRLFSIAVTQSEDGRVFSVSGGQHYQSPIESVVEGDWSNAAFWLSAGAMGDGITVTTLNPNSRQGDSAILDMLAGFGASYHWHGTAVTVTGHNLHGQIVDAAQIPDLVPILAVVAASCEGETRFINAQRLRIKESDRIATVCHLLTALGVETHETEDGLIVVGQKQLIGGHCQSFNDHRIAMSAAIAASMCQKIVTLDDFEAVNKSYPHFFSDYTHLGGISSLPQKGVIL